MFSSFVVLVVIRRLFTGCLVVVWWLVYGCLVGIRWLSRVIFWLFSCYLAVRRVLFGGSLAF